MSRVRDVHALDASLKAKEAGFLSFLREYGDDIKADADAGGRPQALAAINETNGQTLVDVLGNRKSLNRRERRALAIVEARYARKRKER